MDGPSTISLSGQLALQQMLDVTANNIANANTTGYRGDRTLFQSFVDRLDLPGREVAFVEDRATYIDLQQGAISSTGNPLDVAINGEGFLAVQRPNGQRGYTRDGRMHAGPDGKLMDSAARPILDEGGSPILLPDRTGRIEIRADGSLIATVDGIATQVGRIGLYSGGDMKGIRKAGDGLYDIPATQLQPVDPLSLKVRLVQGALEGSTVQPVSEIANLTLIQRSYDSMQRIIADDDSRLRKMIETLGRAD